MVSASGWLRFLETNDLQEELDRRIQVADAVTLSELFALSSTLQRMIIETEVPDDLAEAILAACRELAAGQAGHPRFVLRASLADPDAPPSFAGQFRTWPASTRSRP